MERKKMGKIKLLALFGRSCSGKNTILEHLLEVFPDAHKMIQYTTRPIRKNEIMGKEYYFVSAEYLEKIKDDLVETNNFNNWIYATSMSNFREDTINIGIFNINSIKQLLENSDFDILPILIDCNKKYLLTRGIQRACYDNDYYELCRRYCADEEDFKEIPFSYLIYDNSDQREIINIEKLPQIKDFFNQK
jgi:guanylate kinase